MQNLFANPAFSMANLTAAINLVPNRYGRLEDLNLFPAKPTRFRQIIIEERNGVLNLLPTMPPGSPGTVGTRGKRKVRSFVIPHIPHDDVVLPEEVQGIRAFGSETELETLAGVLARHLETMRNKHAITLEHLRMGALKGEILDADGSVISNLFTEFQITPQSVNFDLANANSEVKGHCYDLLTKIEDALQGAAAEQPEGPSEVLAHRVIVREGAHLRRGEELRRRFLQRVQDLRHEDLPTPANDLVHCRRKQHLFTIAQRSIPAHRGTQCHEEVESPPPRVHPGGVARGVQGIQTVQTPAHPDHLPAEPSHEQGIFPLDVPEHHRLDTLCDHPHDLPFRESGLTRAGLAEVEHPGVGGQPGGQPRERIHRHRLTPMQMRADRHTGRRRPGAREEGEEPPRGGRTCGERPHCSPPTRRTESHAQGCGEDRLLRPIAATQA